MSHKKETSHYWAVDRDGDFTLQRRLTPMDKLEDGIYLLQISMTGMYLVRQGDEFKLPDPLYGVEEEFIERIIKTYKHGQGFAAMLTGTKGTGKTVTCQKIANSLNQPCIIVPNAMPGLVGFLACIPQPVTVFIDEYEKLFKPSDNGEGGDSEALLPLLDGPLKGTMQRLFLLTSNSMNINQNMVQRPGRIRYVKHYGNLPLPTIREVLTDRLLHSDKIEPTLRFITSLETITLDIVTAVADEVNIHADDPETYTKFFNVKQLVVSYDVYEHKRDQEFPKLVQGNCKISPDVENMDEGDDFYINRTQVGTIKTVLEDGCIVVEAFERDEKGQAIQVTDPNVAGEIERRYKTYLRKFELRKNLRANDGMADPWNF